MSVMVPRERLELPTCGLGNRCSVLLSYRGTLLSIWRVSLRVNDMTSGAKMNDFVT